MKVRNILIALVVIGAAFSGAAAMFSRPLDNNNGKSLVSNRPIGVAYAQEGQGGNAPPPGGGAPPPGGAAAPAASAEAPKSDLTDEEWLKKLEEWKNSDPRDIIKAKYEDLQSKETHPDNEDNPEQFIPETGRVDPLTIVNGAVPDELKPPRSGETDVNAYDSYLYSAAASEVVDAIGIRTEVYNVLQIGLEKIVSIRTPDGLRRNLREGSSYRLFLESSDGIPVQVSFSLSSAKVDEVIITITGEPWGSVVSISKDFHYIPRN